MKKILIFLLLFINVYGFAQNALSPKKIEELKRSVVEIITYDNFNQITSGTGFILDNKTIVTNYHVIKNAISVEIKDYYGTIYHSNGFYTVDYENDIALLNVNEDDLLKLNIPIKFSKKAPQIGDEIHTIGFPLSSEYRYDNGIVNNISLKLDKTPYYNLEINLGVNHGASGSPIFNKKGKVVSMVKGGIPLPSGNFNFGVDYYDLRKAIYSNLRSVQPYTYLRNNINKNLNFYNSSATMLVKNITQKSKWSYSVNAKKNDLIHFKLVLSNQFNGDSIDNLIFNIEGFQIGNEHIFTYVFHSKESEQVFTGNCIVKTNKDVENIKFTSAIYTDSYGNEFEINTGKLMNFYDSVRLGKLSVGRGLKIYIEGILY